MVAAAIVSPDRQLEQSLLRKLLKYLVDATNPLCTLGGPISALLTDTESVRFRGRVAVKNFCTSVATRLGKVLYSSAVIIPRYCTDSRTKKGFRVKGGDFVASLGLKHERLGHRSAHRIRRSDPRTVTFFEQLTTFLKVLSTEEQIPSSIFCAELGLASNPALMREERCFYVGMKAFSRLLRRSQCGTERTL